jgi:DnaJ-class molecular chaperone
MDSFRNHYRVLDIDSTADEATIKAAFRRLARRYHPDLAKNARAGRRFQEIREAYDVLSDPDKRRQYDEIYRAQTALRRVSGRGESRKVRARAGGGSAGLGIALDVLGLRVGLAVGAQATRGAAPWQKPVSRKPPRRS